MTTDPTNHTRLMINNLNLTQTCFRLRVEIDTLHDLLQRVEDWWLTEEAPKHQGAPAIIFDIREYLARHRDGIVP